MALDDFPEELVARAVRDADGLDSLERRMAEADRTVVVAGSSIPDLVLAARLGAAARSDRRLAVVLVAGPPEIPRRLIAGCSLRWGPSGGWPGPWPWT